MNLLTSERFFSLYHSKPDPKVIAQQLRKPSGEFADKVVTKMNEANAPLYDLTLKTLQIDDNNSILEIGFGSGEFFKQLFEQADNLEISGIDHSRDMVEMASKTNKQYIETEELTLNHGNSSNLPYPDNSFDIVFCNMVIYFWDQPVEHLEEVRRVLKSGGRFYTGLRSKSSMKKLPFIDHGFNVYEVDEWSSLLSANGFRVADIIKNLDPSTEIEGKKIRMESICIIAEKL